MVVFFCSKIFFLVNFIRCKYVILCAIFLLYTLFQLLVYFVSIFGIPFSIFGI